MRPPSLSIRLPPLLEGLCDRHRPRDGPRVRGGWTRLPAPCACIRPSSLVPHSTRAAGRGHPACSSLWGAGRWTPSGTHSPPARGSGWSGQSLGVHLPCRELGCRLTQRSRPSPLRRLLSGAGCSEDWRVAGQGPPQKDRRPQLSFCKVALNTATSAGFPASSGVCREQPGMPGSQLLSGGCRSGRLCWEGRSFLGCAFCSAAGLQGGDGEGQEAWGWGWLGNGGAWGTLIM